MQNELIKYKYTEQELELLNKDKNDGEKAQENQSYTELYNTIGKPLSKNKLKPNQFIETYNIQKVKYVSQLSIEKFKEIFLDPDQAELNTKAYVKSQLAGLHGVLKEVRALGRWDDQYIKIPRTYKRINNGRIYVQGWGLQKCPGTLRKFLNGEYTYDIDMYKSHFQIIVNICEENNISCNAIKNFLKDPDQFYIKNDMDKVGVITLLYCDTYPISNHTEVNDLHIEKQYIYNVLKQKIPNTFKPTPGSKHPISSQISKYIQMREYDILSPILTKYQNLIEVGAHDGFQITTRADIAKTLKIINEMTQYTWIQKDNLFTVDMSDYEESNDYLTWVREFEKYVFALNEPQRMYAVDYRNNPTLFTPTALCDRFVSQPHIKTWIKDDYKLSYRKMDYHPHGLKETDPTAKDVFNIFKPYQRPILDEVVTEEDIKWFIDLITKSLVNYKNLDDEEIKTDEEIIKAKEWLLHFLAGDIQHPGVNPQSFLVLRGQPGGGKDTLFQILDKLKKDKRTLATDKIDLFLGGEFNSSLEGVENVLLNECGTADIKQVSDALKNHVTAETITINEKYRKPFEIQNYCKLMFATNNAFPLEASDRRAQMFETANWGGSWRPKKKEFFDIIYKHINDDASMDKLWTFLNQRNIGDWIPYKNLYNTPCMIQAKGFSLPSQVRFSQYILDNRMLINDETDDLDNEGDDKPEKVQVHQTPPPTKTWSIPDFKTEYKLWATEEYGDKPEKPNVIKYNLQSTQAFTWGKNDGSRFVKVDYEVLAHYLKIYNF